MLKDTFSLILSGSSSRSLFRAQPLAGSMLPVPSLSLLRLCGPLTTPSPKPLAQLPSILAPASSAPSESSKKSLRPLTHLSSLSDMTPAQQPPGSATQTRAETGEQNTSASRDAKSTRRLRRDLAVITSGRQAGREIGTCAEQFVFVTMVAGAALAASSSG